MGGSRTFDPKSRSKQDKSKVSRWLLDSKHENQAFMGGEGADFALQKELKEAGMVALKSGRGYAVTIDPKSDWLQPFGKTVVTCTCYSDVPGLMEDDLVITIGKLKSHAEGGDYRIPMRVLSCGNPLYLPDQQVGLNNQLAPARLLIETITPAAKTTTRTFKVGNNSMTKVHLSWKIMSQLQVQAIEDRKLAIENLREEAATASQRAQAEAAEAKRRAEEEAAAAEAAAAEAAEAGEGQEAAAEAEAADAAAAAAQAEAEAGEGAEGAGAEGEDPAEEAAEEVLEAIDTRQKQVSELPQFAIINGVSARTTEKQADLLAAAYGSGPALTTMFIEKWAKETLKRTVDVTNHAQMFAALQQYADSTGYQFLVLNRYPKTDKDTAAFLSYFGAPKVAAFFNSDEEAQLGEFQEENPPKENPDEETEVEEIIAMLEAERKEHERNLEEFQAKCPSSVMSINMAEVAASNTAPEALTFQIRAHVLSKEEILQVKDPFALESGDPPLRIEPEEATLPIQGTATFTVTMLASKATKDSMGHYQYRLVGEGRYTQDRGSMPEEAAPAPQPGPEMTQKPTFELAPKPASKVVQGVARLPEIRLDTAELHDDDSDIEDIPVGETAMDKTQKLSEGEAEKQEQAVISTLTIDCVGDCIVPRLIVDKKGNPSIQEFADGDDRKAPVFKFVHSSVDMQMAAQHEQGHHASTGVKLSGQAGGTPHQGIGSCLLREVTLANENLCHVYCRFRIEGPFRIKMAEQAGKKPVHPAVVEKVNKKQRPTGEKPEDPIRQLFAVPPRSTLTLQVEFVPGMVPRSQWTHNAEYPKMEQIFKGDIVVEYPRDESTPDQIVDLQRVHLMSTSRKPSIRLNLIPYTTLDPPVENPRAELPPWAEQPPMLIEFGYVHVESAIARTRVILLSSENNVVSRWRLLHVGRKRKPPLEIGVTAREDEDFRALDDREAFSFDVSEGELHGPSKDVLVPGSEVRQPRWCPVTPALPKRLPHIDEARFEPRKVVITFKPSKNEVYKCKFRVQVDEGRSIDFICHGCGSYDEEDDAMEYQEA